MKNFMYLGIISSLYAQKQKSAAFRKPFVKITRFMKAEYAPFLRTSPSKQNYQMSLENPEFHQENFSQTIGEWHRLTESDSSYKTEPFIKFTSSRRRSFLEIMAEIQPGIYRQKFSLPVRYLWQYTSNRRPASVYSARFSEHCFSTTSIASATSCLVSPSATQLSPHDTALPQTKSGSF